MDDCIIPNEVNGFLSVCKQENVRGGDLANDR
jgi:hypothetical protein